MNILWLILIFPPEKIVLFKEMHYEDFLKEGAVGTTWESVGKVHEYVTRGCLGRSK